MKEMIYKTKFETELLDSGTYNGYEYAIVSRGMHPCAYIKLPEGHKYYGLSYDDIPVDCHGGLTYAESCLDVLPERSGWWIGWDYGHCCDYAGFMNNPMWSNADTGHYKKWTTSEIFVEVKEAIKQLKEIDEAMRLGIPSEEIARSLVYLAKSGSI